MSKKSWILTVAGVLILGGGGYGACALATGPDASDGEGVVGGVVMEPGDAPDDDVVPGETLPYGLDAGSSMDVPDEAPPGQDLPEAEAEETVECGEGTCAPGEACCYPVGTCYPADCEDCCDQLVRRDPPEPPPERVDTATGPDDEPGLAEPPRRGGPTPLPEPPRPNEAPAP